MFDNAKLWDLPSVDDKLAETDTSTNALDRPRGKWKFEAPEEEEEITPLTAEDIEAIRQSAYQEGLKAGHEEGLKNGFEEGIVQGTEQGQEEGHKIGLEQGLESANEQIKIQTDILSSLINHLQQPLAQVQIEAQKELVILAKSLAQAVIKVETTQNEAILLRAIEDGMKALPIQQSQYTLYLNNEDLARLESHFGETYIAQQNWHLVASEDIAYGGVKIQTKNNAVDMSIAKRCEEVFAKLLFEQGITDDPRSK